MKDLVTDAAPQAESPGRRRPARLLLGWVNQEAAERALAEPGSAHPTSDQVARIVAARSAVARRDPYVDSIGVTTPAIDAVAEYEHALRTRPATTPYFDEGWRVGVVDLTRVIAMQPQVNLDRADERVVGVSPGDLIAAASITLPLDGNVQFAVQPDEGQMSWLITSDNPNLRVLGMSGQSVPNAVPFFGFNVGAGPSYMQVARFKDRHILRDGYHRAIALLRAGVTEVPAFVREYETAENLVPVGMLAQRQFLGERPPFLPDFLNDEVSVEIATPASRKLVFITVRELMQAS